jgi:hypothetical protein
VIVPTYSSFSQACRERPRASYVSAIKSTGGLTSLFESELPGGVTADAAAPDLVLRHTLVTGCRVGCNLGSGRFGGMTRRGGLFLAAPDFTATVQYESDRCTQRMLSPRTQWRKMWGLPSATSSHLTVELEQLAWAAWYRKPDFRCLRSRTGVVWNCQALCQLETHFELPPATCGLVFLTACLIIEVLNHKSLRWRGLRAWTRTWPWSTTGVH